MTTYVFTDYPTVRHRLGKTKVESADGYSGGNYHRFIKRQKRRYERHKAKIDPQYIPTYRKYDGYEL